MVVQNAGKSGELEESTTKSSETLNKDSVEGEEGTSSGGSLGVISAVVSAVVIVVLGGVIYVSFESHSDQEFDTGAGPGAF